VDGLVVTPDPPPRETCPLDTPARCQACGTMTDRYVIVDWTVSCGPAFDPELDRQLGEELDRLAARLERPGRERDWRPDW
jgi:hypothetical protein